MNTIAPNLYYFFNLDAKDDCDELGLLLIGKSASLEQAGFSEASNHLNIAYGILSDEQNRALYDATIQQRDLSWAELEHLANFGQFPTPLQTAPTPPPPPVFQAAPTPAFYAAPQPVFHTLAPPLPPAFQATPQPAFYAAPPPPVAPGMPVVSGWLQPSPITYTIPSMSSISADPEYDRPSALTRLTMGLLDITIIASIVAAVMGIPFSLDGSLWESLFTAPIVWTLLSCLYGIGFEVTLGATPAKLAFGYTVRDVTSGKKLTLWQSIKRNWWRLSSLVPSVGAHIFSLAAIINFLSINKNNNRRAPHDRFANAEVAKKL